jgi:coproporphyrinogen III oxidase
LTAFVVVADRGHFYNGLAARGRREAFYLSIPLVASLHTALTAFVVVADRGHFYNGLAARGRREAFYFAA